MISKSKNHCYFKRIDNILIEVLSTGVEIPVLFFKQNFIDVPKLNPTSVDYMNRYAEMFPQLIEKIEKTISESSSNDQLTLF